MMNYLKYLAMFAIAGFLLSACSNHKTSFVKENTSFAAAQTRHMLANTGEPQGKCPRTTDHDGKLVMTDIHDWVSGFFPGSLWYIYELTGDTYWKDEAGKWTDMLEPLKTFTGGHDLGFMMNCSYGNGYRLTQNEAYKQILIESANSLSTRFSPVTGCIKSWNSGTAWDDSTKWEFPVIVDNMMNLELLFLASKLSGNNSYRDIAISHANMTIKNHLRPDFSSYHVVDYDPVTGAVKDQATHQGFSDNSTWARGQAWGIYGFTLMFRETQNPAYLKVAKGMTDFYLNHSNLPEDLIPYWDFNVGQQGYVPEWKYDASKYPEIQRDASAGAIVASALFELAGYTGDAKYQAAAEKMLHSLASASYRAPLNTNAGFLLMHSVGRFPHGHEIDVPLVYADYYFLEALIRYKNFR